MPAFGIEALAGLQARPRDGSSLTGLDEVAATGWLPCPDSHQVFAQTLYRRDGYATTLLLAEQDGDASETTRGPPRFRR